MALPHLLLLSLLQSKATKPRNGPHCTVFSPASPAANDNLYLFTHCQSERKFGIKILMDFPYLRMVNPARWLPTPTVQPAAQTTAVFPHTVSKLRILPLISYLYIKTGQLFLREGKCLASFQDLSIICFFTSVTLGMDRICRREAIRICCAIHWNGIPPQHTSLLRDFWQYGGCLFRVLY